MIVTPPEDSNNMVDKGNNSQLTQMSFDENKKDIELGSLEGTFYALSFEIRRM